MAYLLSLLAGVVLLDVFRASLQTTGPQCMTHRRRDGRRFAG
jgi:hypothetical protein